MTARPLTATYRLQFSRDFTFDDARRLVPYLRDLGVSHLYASPIFQARPGSTHGYDVIDHDAINTELGGEAGLRRLVEALHEAGLGVIADIVPNHAGVGGVGNARWQDVLELGRRSRNARFFDIDWSAGPLVLPILEAPIEEVVADGKLVLAVDATGGRIHVAYGENRLPLRPQTLSRFVEAAGRRIGRDDLAPVAREWAEQETSRAAASGRRMRRERLSELFADPEVAEALDAELAAADPVAVAGEQHYRLMFWREGAAAINYRRFFDITDLAGLRVEEPTVFEAVHRLPLALIREGWLDGLRVDHVDGLADPAAYCRHLREELGPGPSIHLEKILGADEPLRGWPVDGTTGYETLNLINGLFVDPDGYRRLALARNGGQEPDLEGRMRAVKREILERSFSSELDVLARLGADLSRRAGHPVRLGTVREIVVGLISALPVYRTYVNGPAGPEDRRLIEAAAAEARADLSRGERRALATLVGIILAGSVDAEAAGFIRRFQQLSGPAMAKGYEDTELYRFIGLASVNEVGSHLTRPTVSIEHFHAVCGETARRGLRSLTPLSTHDTKRGADTRARLNVLSEMAEEWLDLCARWRDRHQRLRSAGTGAGEAPDRTDEDLVYQTLLGVWPVGMDRIEGYLLKALREAKRRTTWVDRNEPYEQAVVGFARTLVEDEAGAAFRTELGRLLERVGPAGRLNGLSQTALQLTVPGVPDVYRGSEFFEHVLVDPDNRRPVDWESRIRALDEGSDAEVADDLVGTTKQRLIASLLSLRRDHAALFLDGSYEPLPVAGAQDVIAFARRLDGRAVVTVAATRALDPPVGDVVVDLGNADPFRWRPIAGPREVRSEGRLLRIDRSSLPAVIVGSARTAS